MIGVNRARKLDVSPVAIPASFCRALVLSRLVQQTGVTLLFGAAPPTPMPRRHVATALVACGLAGLTVLAGLAALTRLFAVRVSSSSAAQREGADSPLGLSEKDGRSFDARGPAPPRSVSAAPRPREVAIWPAQRMKRAS